ncbi:MAG: septal ring lytic transglycosylase RlpA family protein [Patescibacteria group bacterium]|nr:septal ring lytic transglycosylase RlpA family protein [Patescibacteria group bacterium]
MIKVWLVLIISMLAGVLVYQLTHPAIPITPTQNLPTQRSEKKENARKTILCRNVHYTITTSRLPRSKIMQIKIEALASWYGEIFHGKIMANGEKFDKNNFTIATNLSKTILPLNQRVTVQNPRTKKEVIARVTDRGPWDCAMENGKIELVYLNEHLVPHPERKFDLSERMARELGFWEKGVEKIIILFSIPAES